MLKNLFSRKRSAPEPEVAEAPEPTAWDQAVDKIAAAQIAYWREAGRVEPELMGYLMGGVLSGRLVWPGGRDAFQIVRRSYSVIISTAGLSYPDYADETGAAPGLGMEVFVDAPGYEDSDMRGLGGCPAFPLLEQAAMQIVEWGGVADLLIEDGAATSVFPFDPAYPDEWRTEEGGLGVLIGAPAPDLGSSAKGSSGQILMVPVLPLHPSEIAVAAVDRAGR